MRRYKRLPGPAPKPIDETGDEGVTWKLALIVLLTSICGGIAAACGAFGKVWINMLWNSTATTDWVLQDTQDDLRTRAWRFAIVGAVLGLLAALRFIHSATKKHRR